MIAMPSSTGGLNTCPRSVERTECSGPASRMCAIHSSQAILPVCGVVMHRSSRAPRPASAC